METRVNWAKYAHKFGTMPDGQLAETIGVTRKAVQYQRNRRGIAAFNKPHARKGVTISLVLPREIVEQLNARADLLQRSRSKVASSLLREALF
jgi:hypothetical protein